MREIKFRAWDKRLNKIRPIEEINFDRMEVAFNDTGKEDNYKFDYASFEEIKLMQYTGLEDKNGKGICEGDILKIVDSSGDDVIISVQFLYGTFVDSYFHWTLGNIKMYKREIIGNIYENPELLKEK